MPLPGVCHLFQILNRCLKNLLDLRFLLDWTRSLLKLVQWGYWNDLSKCYQNIYQGYIIITLFYIDQQSSKPFTFSIYIPPLYFQTVER